MGFLVPDEAAASYTDQAELDAIDLQILGAGFIGTGVLTGCAVTAQSTPDGTVAVSSGTYRVNGTTYTLTGGNVSVLSGSANTDGSTNSAANASYFRYDLIVADSSSHIGVLHGVVPTPTWPDYSVNPVFPAVTFTTNVVLAACLIPPTSAAITGIATAQIIRKDLVLNQSAFHPIDPIPTQVMLFGSAATWTDQPSGLTEFIGTTSNRHSYDFTGVTSARFKARIVTAGVSGSRIFPQYSTDDITYANLATTVSTDFDISMTAAGTKRTSWAAIAAGAKIDPVYIRVAGQDGNAAADPALGQIELEVR
jgi:hypothetical protein